MGNLQAAGGALRRDEIARQRKRFSAIRWSLRRAKIVAAIATTFRL
ncbi:MULTISPECIES: hypothetical protein [Bradyrhizobium]|nr:hypothetical protein [Bradyrhizobium elkanii]WLA83362.1 hypothetical protein QNJ99_03220 [Bradyrhizobium elkanii]